MSNATPSPRHRGATLPPVRVAQALRSAAEAALRPGETLSSFVEHAVAHAIEERTFNAQFLARGLAAGQRSRAENDYVTPEALLEKLRGILEAARKDTPTR